MHFYVFIQRTQKKSSWIVLFYLCFIIHSATCNISYIFEGNAWNCDNEGGSVFPRSPSNIHCFSCVCKSGQVECIRNKCPHEEGCYMLEAEMADPQGCCKKCKGCWYQGKFYESGTEWTDESDPCLTMTCKAGVVTESTIQCYTPCHSPVAPRRGECCPSCLGCRINGQNFSSNRSLTLLEDPCLKCSCHAGKMKCSKKACPVLQCPPSSVVHKVGECCPRCNGTRKVFDPPRGNCLLGKSIRLAGKTERQDDCTYCSCVNSTSICRRETCPPIDCPPEKQIYPNDGKCCPRCPSSYENRTICNVGEKIYQDGETWQANECKSCMCNRGQIKCIVEVCSQSINMPCPPNMKYHKDPGACCPKCVEEDAVCTVFGDPHYKTFDGKFYSFQGSCKYQLTGDCVGQTFSIRVTNDARATKTSSWTRTISIRMGKMKVNLGDRMRVKVNGERVAVPYRRENFATVTRTSDSVLVETHLGVKVIWDGNSFLEVSVPASYKNKLCGLCGNYNSSPRDDFTTRDGRVVFDPLVFASSWQVGGRKACQRAETRRRLGCHNAPHKKMRDRLCKPIRSDTFSACHEKLNAEVYFKSCLEDMCECPGKKCYCDSLTAYAHECQRLGILLPDWRMLTGCSVNGSRFY
ncbi:BMP-binding endothelial regulator protein isoform X2 [Planococcus citri]|uniref:BMP-binding endothelial regulator protein isoform X2 n=1 Tax=Planococcus citri TaxID=170843 RepID=UPI0031F97A48